MKRDAEKFFASMFLLITQAPKQPYDTKVKKLLPKGIALLESGLQVPAKKEWRRGTPVTVVPTDVGGTVR